MVWCRVRCGRVKLVFIGMGGNSNAALSYKVEVQMKSSKSLLNEFRSQMW